MTGSDQQQHAQRIGNQVLILVDLLRFKCVNEATAEALLRNSVISAVATGWTGWQRAAFAPGTPPWAVKAFADAGVPARIDTEAGIAHAVRAVLDEMTTPDFHDLSDADDRDLVAWHVAKALAPLVLPAS